MLYIMALVCACIYISVLDVRSRRISNSSITVLLLLQSVLLLESEVYLTSALAVLAIGLVLFWRRWIAAGDIKLASVLALGLPLGQLPIAATLTGLAGGLVSLFYLMINYWFPNRKKRQVGIPYGVAISLGFCLVIALHQVPMLLKA